MDIKNKNITIIGAVKSGVGAAKLIKKLGGHPFVSDSGTESKLTEYITKLKAADIEFEIGSHSERIFQCEIMIVSPGVPSNAEVLVKAREKGIKLISEIELAGYFCKGNIIAITGTNGKTTTTSLCGHIMNACGFKTYLAGNIGLAFSEIALDVKEDEFVSLEVSSFQLDLIDGFKPKVAMILNITPDHLNRYENKFENYINSKLRIYKNMDAGDYLVLNNDDEVLTKSLTKRNSKDLFFSLNKEQNNGCYVKDGKVIFARDGKEEFSCGIADINLKGEHNIANAMASICAAKIFGGDNKKITGALSSFQGVEHRLEFVREIDGVKFINDSKATNVDSVWYALKSFDEPIFLILGGLDKGNDYNQIKDLVLKNVVKIYAIGSSADKVFNFFHSFVKVEIKPSLQEVVLAANNEARQNEIVLLSPACASFDMFDSYEHRGKVFKEAVNNL